jgi:hypothetical protein
MFACPYDAISDDGEGPSSRPAFRFPEQTDPERPGLSGYGDSPVDVSTRMTIVAGIVLIFGVLAMLIIVAIYSGV